MVSVPSSNVVAVDTEMSWENLAAIPETYATAWACLNRNLELLSGQTILVRGATSALGQAAVNIGVGLGANVIGTARDRNKFELLEALGATPILDRDDLSTHIRNNHSDGIDAVLDIVGNSTIIDSLAMVRFGGRACLAGFLGGSDPVEGFNPLMQMPSGVQFSFFGSAFVFGTEDFPLSQIPFQKIIDKAASGNYLCEPAHTFDLTQIVEAHTMMEANSAKGKIVIRV